MTKKPTLQEIVDRLREEKFPDFTLRGCGSGDSPYTVDIIHDPEGIPKWLDLSDFDELMWDFVGQRYDGDGGGWYFYWHGGKTKISGFDYELVENEDFFTTSL